MPYLFTCPHCQTQTLVDDQFSGHVGRCVTCDQRIEVPHFAVAVPTDAQPQGRAQRRPLGGLSPWARRFIAATLCAVAFFGLLSLVYRYGAPAITTFASGRSRAIAIRNLEQIASALNAYAADHGAYPLPIVRDSTGRAMHSWRVAILPYLDQNALFNSYDFDQPWDSSDNYKLVEAIPSVYVSPSSLQWSGFECHYHLVTGDRTLFPRSGPLGPKQVIDEASQTALVVEGVSSPNVSSVWTEPNELDFQAMTGTIGGNPGVEIGSVTEDGVVFATVDGVGHFLPESTPAEIVRAILTASGGEPLADDVLD
jgi:predicted Zn finger-like uncharacterized protein